MSVRLKNLTASSLLLLGLIAAPQAGANAAPGRHAAQASVTLTYWWWAESDIPGADKWMRQTVALFEKAHPTIQIKLDIQGTDNLISNFQAAAAAHSGPDIGHYTGTLPGMGRGHFAGQRLYPQE